MGGVTAQNLATAGHDLSLWGLFLQADWVVKAVMIGLLLASVWVWAIVFEKVTSIRRANKAADAFEDAFWSGGSLDDLFRKEGDRPSHPMAAVFVSAMREWRRGAQRLGGSDFIAAGLKERIDRTMAVTVQREMERLERWMIFLASVGSVAPFIGLFGTVWGIMNSFAAIPAVLAYNKISSDLARFASRMEGFASEFGAILSRQTESAAADPTGARATAPVAE